MQHVATAPAVEPAEAPAPSEAPAARAEGKPPRRYGTFVGVFTPTLLTILGVIMYRREGWVVGNAGLLGAGLIVLLGTGITACTGLSMSSITTNIRIGAGGPYSIISRSLGLEIGGSVGLPLYLSQALAVTIYIFGFREGWLWIFPSHDPLAVDLVTFAALYGIALVGANLAFRIQFVTMALIAGSLVSIAVAAFAGDTPAHPPQLWGTFPGAPEDGFAGTSFWLVFAVFFPATTGIMAGANMSGELKHPARSIPRGTLWAIGLSTVIYLLLAWWLSTVASPEELASDYDVMIERSAWPPAVLAGLLGATFSSALVSIVGAPRILQALGGHQLLPGSSWVNRLSRRGEPRNAVLLTGGLVLLALLVRDLNAIAPLVSLFFLITYAMLNFVVLVEQSLGLVSFRPRLRIPLAVPLLGFAGCVYAMFLVSATFSLLALAVVVAAYGYLSRRRLAAPFGDVRSGLFTAVAEWAARRAGALRGPATRAWKPHLLVPVAAVAEARGLFRLLYDIAAPKGSVKLVGLAARNTERMASALEETAEQLRTDGIFSSWTVIEDERWAQALVDGVQALRSAFFTPNVLVLRTPPDAAGEAILDPIIAQARLNGLGVIVLAEHHQARAGRERTLNLWFPDVSPHWDAETLAAAEELDLAILVTYKLLRNWSARVRLVTAVADPDQVAPARAFLQALLEVARLPQDAELHVAVGSFEALLADGPRADLDVFGLRSAPDWSLIQRAVVATGSTCLFVRDSDAESALV